MSAETDPSDAGGRRAGASRLIQPLRAVVALASIALVVAGLACGASGGTPTPPSAAARTALPTFVATPRATAAVAAPMPSSTAPPTAVTADPTALLPPPTATVEAAPPAQPSPTPSPPMETTLRVYTRGLSVEPAVLSIPSHVPVTLVMVNEHAGVPHDIGVNVVGGGRTDTCTGPCTSSFVFAAHVPGSYEFFCSLHPEMVGRLNVK